MAKRTRRESRKLTTLVTGGAGFVGSHLCERLIAEGHEVVCLDNLLTGRESNIQRLLDRPQFRFLRYDITQGLDSMSVTARSQGSKGTDAPLAERFDYIMHLASPASPKDYLRHPIPTLRSGSFGTYYALELAKAHGSVFLVASSSEVYGDPKITPQPETYWGHVNPIGPRSVYDEAKRFAEAITMAYHRKHGVETRIARLFNTYGERMRINDGRVLPNFMMQALQNKPLTVYGEGKQTRSLCYVKDTVEGLFRLLLSKETEPVNIGNPDEISILELAREIIELTGSRSRIVFRPLPIDDPQRRKPDISKAIRELGWRPKVRRREGIKRVIPYFRAKVQEMSKVSR
ncbi:MAG: SDR family oxidoreductase [Acidobacteria bacterium]|nr:SDR family oxidoreductase [Acidobacteriota bacterium]